MGASPEILKFFQPRGKASFKSSKKVLPPDAHIGMIVLLKRTYVLGSKFPLIQDDIFGFLFNTNVTILSESPGGGALPYKPTRDVPFFRVRHFSA